MLESRVCDGFNGGSRVANRPVYESCVCDGSPNLQCFRRTLDITAIDLILAGSLTAALAHKAGASQCPINAGTCAVTSERPALKNGGARRGPPRTGIVIGIGRLSVEELKQLKS